MLRRLRLPELHVAEATRLVTLLDGDSSGDNVAVRLERLVELTMRPLIAETLYEDIALSLDTPQQVLIVRQGSARFAVQLREFYLLEELASVKDVLESSKGVVKVLHLRPIDEQENRVGEIKKVDLPFENEVALACH